MESIAAASLGAGAFALVCGWTILSPSNIAWLAEGDPASHYLAWAFFRNSPWQWPPGYNPDYGLETGSSIFFSDSIPLLAMAFKSMSVLLPHPFQYVGIWLLGCFVLQGILAWKLAGAIGLPLVMRSGAAMFLLFAPPFLFRLIGHYALVGHWTILCGLYLYLKPGLRWATGWPPLLVLGALIHPYLLAMLVALWLGALAKRLLLDMAQWPRIVAELGFGLAGTAFALWAAGFFIAGIDYQAGGYGIYRMNLGSLLDSNGWSYLLKDMPNAAGDYEGFNFLGLGGLGLALFALPGVWRGHARQLFNGEWMPLLIVLAGLAVFAISNSVAIGTYEVIHISLPAGIDRIANMLRGSGRMFWPVWYGMVLGGIWLLHRYWGTGVASLILACLLLVQIIDTSSGWTGYRARFSVSGSRWSVPQLSSPLWERASAVYREVRVIPSADAHSSDRSYWKIFGYLAASHGMAVNVAYLARANPAGMQVAESLEARAAEQGSFDNKALYVMLSEDVVRAVARHVRAEDLFGYVDGFFVFARGGSGIGTVADFSSGNRVAGVAGTPAALDDWMTAMLAVPVVRVSPMILTYPYPAMKLSAGGAVDSIRVQGRDILISGWAPVAYPGIGGIDIIVGTPGLAETYLSSKVIQRSNREGAQGDARIDRLTFQAGLRFSEASAAVEASKKLCLGVLTHGMRPTLLDNRFNPACDQLAEKR